MVKATNMNEEKKIKAYIDTVDNWKLMKMLILIPIFVFSLVMLPSVFIDLARENAQQNSWAVAQWELSLSIPHSILLYISIFSCFYFIYLVLISKKNKLRSIYLNNMMIDMLYIIFYYQMVVALQLFTKYPIVRYFNWFLFSLSVLIIAYMFLTKTYKLNFFSKLKIDVIAKVAGSLWIIGTIFRIVFEGFRDIQAVFWTNVVFLMPLILAVLSVGLLSDGFENLDFLRKIKLDSEKYREKYGYSILEWYGSKSKEYQNELNNTK